jgi:hypothetical protein
MSVLLSQLQANPFGAALCVAVAAGLLRCVWEDLFP